MYPVLHTVASFQLPVFVLVMVAGVLVVKLHAVE
jgi:hypothetical protein